MFRVYWINFGYYAQDTFKTLDEAAKYAKSKGFDFRIDRDGKPVASGSALGGFRMMNVSDAFLQGRIAAETKLLGGTPKECTYQPNTKQWDDWNKGWTEGALKGNAILKRWDDWNKGWTEGALKGNAILKRQNQPFSNGRLRAQQDISNMASKAGVRLENASKFTIREKGNGFDVLYKGEIVFQAYSKDEAERWARSNESKPMNYDETGAPK
jgi:hypothetical protein